MGDWVMIVRGPTRVILLSVLLLALAFAQKVNISVVYASPDIHQGDLVIAGNDVYVIENQRFDINGSIIVEENATLILKNAIVNFTQTSNGEHTILLRNSVNGNPRLTAENSTITASNYYSSIELYDNSTATILDLDAPNKIQLILEDASNVSLSNSILHSVYTYGFATVQISNSTIITNLWGCGHSTITASSNCTIGRTNTVMYAGALLSTLNVSSSYIEICENWAYSVNCSISNLEPGFFKFWDFKDNCSITTCPNSQVPNVTLNDCEILKWNFGFLGSSNISISKSTLHQYFCDDTSIAMAYDSTFTSLYANDFSIINSVNSTSNSYYRSDQGIINIYWHLAVHAIDSIGQNIPTANVAAYYPNATLAESKLTDADGWTRLTLMEKMMNTTGQYPIGNYTIEATYETHSYNTTVNMTESKQLTLALDFIVPEFPPIFLLPLFVIATLLAVWVHNRKRFVMS